MSDTDSASTQSDQSASADVAANTALEDQTGDQQPLLSQQEGDVADRPGLSAALALRDKLTLARKEIVVAANSGHLDRLGNAIGAAIDVLIDALPDA